MNLTYKNWKTYYNGKKTCVDETEIPEEIKEFHTKLMGDNSRYDIVKIDDKFYVGYEFDAHEYSFSDSYCIYKRECITDGLYGFFKEYDPNDDLYEMLDEDVYPGMEERMDKLGVDFVCDGDSNESRYFLLPVDKYDGFYERTDWDLYDLVDSYYDEVGDCYDKVDKTRRRPYDYDPYC